MFSQTTEYAMRAMAWLAVLDDELVSTPLLAAKTQVPPNYLAKVLQQLASSKLIVGRRGVGGGYRLARPPEEITLLEVVRCVTPVDRIASCPLGKHLYGGKLCPLHQCHDEAMAAVIKILGGCTLASLRKDPERHPLCQGPLGAHVAVPA
jgi:Rrf2 family transcriptional regulator, nitric oxide-sensitive transcriptional repressor